MFINLNIQLLCNYLNYFFNACRNSDLIVLGYGIQAQYDLETTFLLPETQKEEKSQILITNEGGGVLLLGPLRGV